MKQIFALVLVLSLLISLSVFSYAENEKNVVYSEKVELVQGQSVDIPVKLSNNEGIMGFKLFLDYDYETIEINGIRAGELLVSGFFNDSLGATEAGHIEVVWSNTEDVTTDDILFYINITAKKSNKMETEIRLSYSQEDTFNEDWQDVVLNCSNISIDIVQNSIGIFCEDVVATAGTDVEVPITFKGVTVESLSIKLSTPEGIILKDVYGDSGVSVEFKFSNGYTNVLLYGLSTAENTILIKLSLSEEVYGRNMVLIETDGFEKTQFCVDVIADNKPTVTVKSEKVYGEVGETIIVPVKINCSAGLMGIKLIFNYDEDVICPESIRMSESFSGNIADNIGLKDGVFAVVWNHTENIIGEFVMFEIRFLVLKDTATEIKIDYSQEDAFNENWDDVIVRTEPIPVNDKIIFSAEHSITKINYISKVIFGFTQRVTDLSDYIFATSGYTLSCQNGVGTGKTIDVYNSTALSLEESYTIVIFGDVNGDGWYDGQDAVLVSCLANGMLTCDDVSEAVYMAADCNHDGVINEADVELLNQAGILLTNVDQSRV